MEIHLCLTYSKETLPIVHGYYWNNYTFDENFSGSPLY